MRLVTKPHKKWTVDEENILLDFLLENIDIEKPTSTLYYSKCLIETKLEATPEMMRCKVRYWRTTFSKAEEWRRSTGAAGLDVDDTCWTTKEKLIKMCPHYERLAEIFCHKQCSNTVTESATLTTSTPLPKRSFVPKFKIRTPKNSFQNRIQQKRDAYYDLKMSIEQQRLDLEKERLWHDQQKLELEKQKLAQDLELKKLELEQKERLAVLELKFKYNKE